MTSKFVREAELAELLHDLDAAAIIVGAISDNGPRGLPYDDLNWSVSVIDKAANFVKQSLEDGEKR
jgi:hypothetical protein